jgi:hypothetical protein
MRVKVFECMQRQKQDFVHFEFRFSSLLVFITSKDLRRNLSFKEKNCDLITQSHDLNRVMVNNYENRISVQRSIV